MNDSNRLVLLFDPAWAARQAGVAVIVQGVGAVIFAAVTILLKEVLPSSEWRYVAGLAAVALFLVLLFRALGSRRFRGTLWNTTPMFVTTTALRRTVEELREMLPKLQQIAGDTRRLQVRNNRNQIGINELRREFGRNAPAHVVRKLDRMEKERVAISQAVEMNYQENLRLQAEIEEAIRRGDDSIRSARLAARLMVVSRGAIHTFGDLDRRQAKIDGKLSAFQR